MIRKRTFEIPKSLQKINGIGNTKARGSCLFWGASLSLFFVVALLGEKMNNRKKPGVIALLIVVIICVCTAITFFIVMRLMPQKTSMQKENGTTTEQVEQTLCNVYITASDQNQTSYLFEGTEYTVSGSLGDSYEGIADVTVKAGMLIRASIKPDAIQGVLESYTDGQLEIRDYGTLEREAVLPVYLMTDGSLREGSLKDLIVGSSSAKYVLAHNRIEAVIVDSESIADHIRVLLKNKEGETNSSLYLISDEACQISGENELLVADAGTVIDCIRFMDDRGLSKLRLVSEHAGFYLCDADGTRRGNAYPDTLYCIRTADGAAIVNDVSMEEYIKRVLPSEMPKTFSMEALKAQAVCARTYAYAELKNDTYAAYGANVDDTTAFQVYNTAPGTEYTDAAVKDTAGKVLAYENRPVSCYYCSTNPGVTEDLEVWKTKEERESGDFQVPYLGKHYETADDPGDLSKEEQFRSFIDAAPESYDSISPFYRWTAELLYRGGTDSEYGKLTGIQIKERSRSGYVLSLELSYEKGSRILYHENEIRKFLGHLLKNVVLSNGTIRTDLTLVPSACFYLAAEDGTGVTIKGGGFGHGIGMSQYGAQNIAESGKDFEQILEFYYEGAGVIDSSGLSY